MQQALLSCPDDVPWMTYRGAQKIYTHFSSCRLWPLLKLELNYGSVALCHVVCFKDVSSCIIDAYMCLYAVYYSHCPYIVLGPYVFVPWLKVFCA